MKKVVLITGASGDLGAGLAEGFAKSGYNVVLHYNSNKEAATKINEEILSKYDVETMLIKADITKTLEVENMVNEIIKRFGHIDTLVNNAAVELCSDFFDKTEESFRKVFDVNVIGTFLVSKNVSRYMLEKKYGNIINIGSNNGIDKYDPSTLEYDASKAAIISLTKNMAKQFAPYIRVNAVAPGWIKTNKNIKLDQELNGKFIQSESSKILLNRFAEASEVTNLVLYLSSDNASYINGEVIKIDGGY